VIPDSWSSFLVASFNEPKRMILKKTMKKRQGSEEAEDDLANEMCAVALKCKFEFITIP